MKAKINRNGSCKTPSNQFGNSRTPAKSTKNIQRSPKMVNLSLSTSRGRISQDLSNEPLRLSIKLEDILKSYKKSSTKINLKPELIEPEIESAIPCLEYATKHIQPALTNGKPNSPIETGKITLINTDLKDFNDVFFKKMDDDCKKIEEGFMNDKPKDALSEVEEAIFKKFNCKVKLVQERSISNIPSTVLVKVGNNFDFYSISKC